MGAKILHGEFARLIQSNMGLEQHRCRFIYEACPGIFLLVVCHKSDLVIGNILVVLRHWMDYLE